MEKYFESGRSMVEMLGTLAIIGVLSVGGIMGYSHGMDKYRANTIINDVMLRSVDVIAQFDRTGDANLDSWPTTTAGGYTIGLENETTGIQVDGVPKRLCQMVFDGMISNATVKIGTTEYDSPSDDICGDTNTMVFYVDDGSNVLEGGNIPDNEPNLCEGVFCRECTSCNTSTGRCEPANENLTCNNGKGVCENGECLVDEVIFQTLQCAINDDCLERGECWGCSTWGSCISDAKNGEACQNNTGICQDGQCLLEDCTSNTDCTKINQFCADANDNCETPHPKKCAQSSLVAHKITVNEQPQIIYISKAPVTWWDANAMCQAKGIELDKTMSLVQVNDLLINWEGGESWSPHNKTEFGKALLNQVWNNDSSTIWTADGFSSCKAYVVNLQTGNISKSNIATAQAYGYYYYQGEAFAVCK